jgi:hypothetical protein
VAWTRRSELTIFNEQPVNIDEILSKSPWNERVERPSSYDPGPVMRPAPQPVPWRRRVGRQSVRALIGLILAFALGTGWLINPPRIQRSAVTAIEAARGRVAYNWEWRDGTPIEERPNWPEWLVRAVGVDYFGHVVSVELSGRTRPDRLPVALAHLGNLTKLDHLALTDVDFSGSNNMLQLRGLSRLRELSLRRIRNAEAVLSQIVGLTRLQRLDVRHTQIPDWALAHLERITNLEELDLSHMGISDEGLAHLDGMTNLLRLNLARTRVTSDGLAALAGFTQLQELSLRGTAVTAAGLVHLKGCTALQILELDGTRIGDAGLANLKGLTALQTLTLTRTRITDAGLAHLENLAQLSTLSIDETRVTDEGLIHLENLNKLTVLTLFRTKVTDAGVNKFQLALPRTMIEH